MTNFGNMNTTNSVMNGVSNILIKLSYCNYGRYLLDGHKLFISY